MFWHRYHPFLSLSACLLSMALLSGVSAQAQELALQPSPSDVGMEVGPLPSAVGDFGQAAISLDGCCDEPCGDCGFNDDCCGDCVDSCCGCPIPLWTVRAGAVFMRRDSSDDTVMAFQNVTFAGNQVQTARELLRADVFDFNWELGSDISFMRNTGYGGSVELRTLWLNGMDDVLSGAGNNVELTNRSMFSGFRPPVAPSLTATDPVNVRADYEADFRTVELNYREPFTPWWTVMLGFRYIDLGEDLRIDTVDSNGVALQRTQSQWVTDNDMFGFQVGSEMILSRNLSGWELRGVGKLGIYLNSVSSRVSAGSNIAGAINGTGHDASNETSFAGEFGLLARYNFSCNASFHFGYQAVVLDGVALAPEQMTTTNSVLNTQDIVLSVNPGTVVYHGALLGVEIRR